MTPPRGLGDPQRPGQPDLVLPERFLDAGGPRPASTRDARRTRPTAVLGEHPEQASLAAGLCEPVRRVARGAGRRAPNPGPTARRRASAPTRPRRPPRTRPRRIPARRPRPPPPPRPGVVNARDHSDRAASSDIDPTSEVGSRPRRSPEAAEEDRGRPHRGRRVRGTQQHRGHDTPRPRGSRTSRRPSPSRLSPTTSTTITAPGASIVHGATLHQGAGVEDHRAERRGRRRRAEAEEAQRRLGQHRPRQRQRDLDDDDRRDVRQHVPEHHAPCGYWPVAVAALTNSTSRSESTGPRVTRTKIGT